MSNITSMWKLGLVALFLATAAHAQIGGLGGTGGGGGSGGTGGPQITATTPGNQTPSGTYTQRGVYTGAPSALDYSFNGTGCGTAAPSPSFVANDYSFTATAPATTGTYSVTVCDHANHAIAGTSAGTFTVASGPTISAATPNSQFTNATYTQTGNYTVNTPAALDYSFNSAACGTAATTGLSIGSPAGSYSFTATAPASPGSYTVTVCDHASHAVAGTSGTFSVNALPVETIVADTPTTMTPSKAYVQTGSYTNGPPAALDWSFDGTGCANAATSGLTIGSGSSGTFSFNNTGPSANGSHTITVCDHANHTYAGTSGAFVVSNYVGEGDAVPGATAWVSCASAYNAAYATGTNKGCNLIRASDSHTCDTLISVTGGIGNTIGCSTSGDNGTAVATWCNATTCSVVTAYDQTGNGNNLTQATTTKRPSLILNGGGSANKACIHADSNGAQILIGSIAAHAQPNSATIVVMQVQGLTGAVFSAWTGSGVAMDMNNDNTADIYAGATTVPIAAGLSTYNSYRMVWNGASSNLARDGAQSTGNPGSNGANAGWSIGGSADDGSHNNSAICSAGIWEGVAFTNPQETSLRTVAQTNFNTP